MSALGPDALEPTPRKKLSILVLQMGEIEEVFRSLMALKAVKHLYPEMELHIVTRNGVAGPLKRVEWITSVMETPKIDAKNEDPVTRVATWIDQVIHQNYDILANWTFSAKHQRLAAVATSLIPAMVKVGNYVRGDLSTGSYDAWSMYRESWMRDEGIDQDIHSTDLITTQLLTLLQIHAGDPSPDSTSSAVTSKYFFNNKIIPALPKAWAERPRGLKWIALHASSLSNRTHEWVEMILNRHPDFGIVCLGSSSSRQLRDGRVIWLESELHFDAVVSILSGCSWLVSGKHPIVDLASLLSVRVFYGVQGTTREHSLKWTETGPYGNSHIILDSGSSFKPEIAYACWSYYQSEWYHKNTLTLQTHFSNLGVSVGTEEIKIYRSRIRAADEGGGVSYERTFGTAPEFESWIYRVRGQIARSWFCGWLPSVEQEVSRLSLSPTLIKQIRSLNASLNELHKLAAEGRAIANELSTYAQKTRNGHIMPVEEKSEIEAYGKKLLETEALLSRVVNAEPELRCLLKWYQQMIHNLQGETISAMAKETIQSFDLLTEAVDLLLIYTQKTLERARPKMVRPQADVALLPS